MCAAVSAPAGAGARGAFQGGDEMEERALQFCCEHLRVAGDRRVRRRLARILECNDGPAAARHVSRCKQHGMADPLEQEHMARWLARTEPAALRADIDRFGRITLALTFNTASPCTSSAPNP
jgi:hypothetical protein